MNIDAMIDGIVAREGGYSNRVEDAGGETNWGITKAVARENGYRGAMKDMPRSTAVTIYKNRYWVAPRFAQVAAASERLAEELADTGVNMGVGTASEFLQRCLNVLRAPTAENVLYPKLAVDGAIGTSTLGALHKYLHFRGDEGVRVLLNMLDSLQCAKYIMLAETRHNDLSNVYGWVRNRTILPEA